MLNRERLPQSLNAPAGNLASELGGKLQKGDGESPPTQFIGGCKTGQAASDNCDGARASKLGRKTDGILLGNRWLGFGETTETDSTCNSTNTEQFQKIPARKIFLLLRSDLLLRTGVF